MQVATRDKLNIVQAALRIARSYPRLTIAGAFLSCVTSPLSLAKFLLLAVGIVAQCTAPDRSLQGTPQNPWWTEGHQRSTGIQKLRRLQAEAKGLLGKIASMRWKAAAQDHRRRHATSSCPVTLDVGIRDRYNQTVQSRHP